MFDLAHFSSAQRSIRENRRVLTEYAKLEPNYDEALAAARRLGFGCHGYVARSLVCRLLGRHVRPFAMRTCSGDGSWSIDAECCGIGGCHYPKRRSDPVPAVKTGLELTAEWEPGSSAFWLDPELWSRTPDVNGRPGICWMYLDERPSGAKKPRRRTEYRWSDGKRLERSYIG